MDLTLTSEDATLLEELLESAARDLSYEIANTDNPGYKRGLRERQERIANLQKALTAG